MKKEIINGEICTEVETLEDVFLINQEKQVLFVEEYNGFYYIRFEPESYYDNSMYKINKSTNRAKLIYWMDYFFEVDGKGKRVDPETLKRAG